MSTLSIVIYNRQLAFGTIVDGYYVFSSKVYKVFRTNQVTALQYGKTKVAEQLKQKELPILQRVIRYQFRY